MATADNLSMDRWRVIVVRANSPEVLFINNGRSLALPEVRIPRNQRIVWHLNHQLREVWHLSVVAIAPLPPASVSSHVASVRYYVAELLDAAAGFGPNLTWKDPSVGLPEFVVDPDDSFALHTLNVAGSDHSHQRGPFGDPGWFQEVSLWVKSAAAALGLAWSGDFEQFNASDSFSLMRFATTPRALWFKAVGHSLATDFHVSRLLARRFPYGVPRIVATRPEWLAWLMEECPGSTLDTVSAFAPWQNAALTLAQLQIESAAFVSELLEAQAFPLDRIFSRSEVERFHSIAKEVAASSTRPIADDDLDRIDSTICQCLEVVSRAGIPNALGHLDLNSGNVVVADDHCAYLDWAEAYVGFPFLSFDYLMQSFRRTFGAASPQEAEFVATYLSRWETVTTPAALADAWAVTPVLALFAYILRSIDRCDGDIYGVLGRAEYLASLIRRLNREAVRVQSISAEVSR